MERRLTSLFKLRRSQGFFTLASSVLLWWTQRDLNPRPLRCERSALPAELRAQIGTFHAKKLRILDFWNIRFSGGSPTNRTGKRETENRVGCVSLWMRTERSPN